MADKELVDKWKDLSERYVLLKNKVMSLCDAIKHGDDKHRAWLKNKISEHFDGLIKLTTYYPEQEVPIKTIEDDIRTLLEGHAPKTPSFLYYEKIDRVQAAIDELDKLREYSRQLEGKVKAHKHTIEQLQITISELEKKLADREEALESLQDTLSQERILQP